MATHSAKKVTTVKVKTYGHLHDMDFELEIVHQDNIVSGVCGSL
jgi:hypothetical protein